MPLDWTQGDLAEGLTLYHSSRYFEAHELWENVWRTASEPEKTFLQALIQITAAFHHLQRDNTKGAILLMRASLARLDSYPTHFAQMSVTDLRGELHHWLRALESPDSPRPSHPVQIRPQHLRSAR